MESEPILPKEQTLEMWFREYQPHIEELLEFIKAQGDNEILLQGMEKADPVSIGNLRAGGEYLARVVFEEADERASLTVTRALLFANQVAGIIHHERVGYKLNNYLQEIHDATDSQYRLDIDVRGTYLSQNPSVRNILKYYARDIDQYRGYESLVETAGGMVFMLVERSLEEKYHIREEIRNYSVDYFNITSKAAHKIDTVANFTAS